MNRQSEFPGINGSNFSIAYYSFIAIPNAEGNQKIWQKIMKK